MSALRTVAIVQARMGSTRLPGKVLLPLGEQSVLARTIARVQAAAGVDEVVVATTPSAGDEAIAAEAARCGVRCFRGSENDVLDRYIGAARAAGAGAVVRVTSDCPLFDPSVLAAMLAGFASHPAGSLDYMSNTLVRTYPRGLDAEIVTMAALERAHAEAVAPHEREHVTPYLYQQPGRFRLEGFEGPEDWSAHRWTLDTPADYELLAAIVAALEPAGAPPASTAAILAFLAERPALVALNAHVEQKKLGA